MSSVLESRGVQYSAEAAGSHGNVRCHVIRRALVQDGGARYTIVIFNETDAEASALAFVPARGDTPLFNVVQTIVAPRSEFSTTAVLALTPAGWMPELRVAVNSGDTRFTLEVPQLQGDALPGTGRGQSRELAPVSSNGAYLPVARAAGVVGEYAAAPAPFAGSGAASAPQRVVRTDAVRAQSSPRITPILLTFLAVAGAAGYVIARPRIAEVHVPDAAEPGAAVAVGYRATGLGTADFAVVDPDGSPVAHGSLAFGSGSFAFNLPRAGGAPAYLVRIDVAGPLGSAVTERYVHVSPPAFVEPERPRPAAAHRRPRPEPAAPPQIRSLALDRASVASGESLTVYYDVAAASGTITLLDPAAQITYGKAAISADGHVAFVAPHVDGTRLLTVVANVQRGGASAQSRIAVTVTPETADMPPAAAGDVGASPSATVISAPADAHANAPIRVDIHGATAGLGVVMLDDTGRELARRELAAGQGSVEFAAPAVRVPTRFLFEATYPNGVGTETVVRTITIVP